MRRLAFPILLALASAAFAQKQPAPVTATATATAAVVTDADSRETREQFKELLRRSPSELGIVLKLDPTLFNNQQYLSTYPALAAFVAQHPEVTHNPGFYPESVWVPGDREPRTPTHVMWEKAMEGFM